MKQQKTVRCGKNKLLDFICISVNVIGSHNAWRRMRDENSEDNEGDTEKLRDDQLSRNIENESKFKIKSSFN